MTDTRHLDTAIAIFKGKPGAKRASQQNIVFVVELAPGNWGIQYRGRILQEGFTHEHFCDFEARRRSNILADRTGKPHKVEKL